MTDMLVRLYDVPPLEPTLQRLSRRSINLRVARPVDALPLLNWVRAEFNPWVEEVHRALEATPALCHVATQGNNIVAFACYDVTAPNYFGPMAVRADARQQGVGRAILLSVLHAQKAQGYAYAIIGGVGPVEFYQKTVDAIEIPGSTPGIYGN